MARAGTPDAHPTSPQSPQQLEREVPGAKPRAARRKTPKPGEIKMAAAARRQEIIGRVYENPRTGFGNQEQTLRRARAEDPTITREEVRQFLNNLIVRQDRPERGYNSFVPPAPMFQLQVDLADMSAFAQGPYKYMLVAIDAFSKKLTAAPMANKEASTAARAWDKVVEDLGIPLNVYSDDGSEFKKEFKQKLDYFDIDKIVSRGHATMAERAIRTLKESLVRRLTAGVGRRNQWHLLLPDILAQYNEKPHATTGLAPDSVYENPALADRALARMKRNAKRGAGARPQISVGDLVRVRVKPIEGRGSYRVTEVAWSERAYMVARIDYSEGGPYFLLEGWAGGKLVRRDLRKADAEEQRRNFPMQSRELRGRQAAQARRTPVPGPLAPP